MSEAVYRLKSFWPIRVDIAVGIFKMTESFPNIPRNTHSSFNYWGFKYIPQSLDRFLKCIVWDLISEMLEWFVPKILFEFSTVNWLEKRP